MQLICEAIERSGSTAIADPAERAAHTAKWMSEHVRDKRLLRQLEMIGEDNKQKAELVRMVARENGYTGPCPIADAIESSPSARPAPPDAAPEAAAPLFGWW